MAGNSISGRIDSVVISSGGRPVVSDRSLSQPVNTFELAPTCVPAVSESSSAPNTYSDSGYAEKSFASIARP